MAHQQAEYGGRVSVSPEDSSSVELEWTVGLIELTVDGDPFSHCSDEYGSAVLTPTQAAALAQALVAPGDVGFSLLTSDQASVGVEWSSAGVDLTVDGDPFSNHSSALGSASLSAEQAATLAAALTEAARGA